VQCSCGLEGAKAALECLRGGLARGGNAMPTIDACQRVRVMVRLEVAPCHRPQTLMNWMVAWSSQWLLARLQVVQRQA
jgi:hypothetical protein